MELDAVSVEQQFLMAAHELELASSNYRLARTLGLLASGQLEELRDIVHSKTEMLELATAFYISAIRGE